MENLEKLLTALPKNRLRKRADFKIKFRLYRLIFLNKLETTFDLSHLHLTNLNKGWTLALVVLLVSLSTSVYAYASNSITPGNQLYPLKIAIEKIEEKIAVSSTAKIATYEKFSTRRLQEAVSLSEKNQTSKKSNTINIENIKKNIDTELKNHAAIVESLKNLNKQEAAMVASRAIKNDKEKEKYLDKLADYAKNDKNQEILEKIDKARETINQQKYNFKDPKDKQTIEQKITEDKAETISTSTSEDHKIKTLNFEKNNNRFKNNNRNKNNNQE